MKKVKTLIIIFIISILIALVLILKNIGFIDYLDRGSAYFIDNEKYAHSTSLTNEEYSMTIDMNKLDEYKDKYVIENDLFKVRVISIIIDVDSNIALNFYIESNYNFNSGKIVYIGDVDNNNFNDNKDFQVTTSIEDAANTTRVTAEGPFLKDGYGAGVHIKFDQKVDLSEYNEITFTFKNLMINQYVRN